MKDVFCGFLSYNIVKQPFYIKRFFLIDTERLPTKLFLLEGSETIGLKDRGKCDTENSKYSEATDIAFVNDEPENYVVLGVKNLAIIFPADAHAPYLGSGKYKKALFKVHVGNNRSRLN